MRFAAILLALLAAASARAQQPPLPAIDLTAGMHRIHAEVANDTGSRTQGLMFRKAMAQNAGMVFVFEESASEPPSQLIPIDSDSHAKSLAIPMREMIDERGRERVGVLASLAVQFIEDRPMTELFEFILDRVVALLRPSRAALALLALLAALMMRARRLRRRPIWRRMLNDSEYFRDSLVTLFQRQGYAVHGHWIHQDPLDETPREVVFALERAGTRYAALCVRWLVPVTSEVIGRFDRALAATQAHVGIIVTTTGFSGRIIAGTNRTAQVLIVAGVSLAMISALLVVSGVLHLRWLTQQPGDLVQPWLETCLEYRDRKTNFYRVGIIFLLMGIALYVVAIAVMLMNPSVGALPMAR